MDHDEFCNKQDSDQYQCNCDFIYAIRVNESMKMAKLIIQSSDEKYSLLKNLTNKK